MIQEKKPDHEVNALFDAQKCKCSFRIKLVGDGCPTCNPKYWQQFEPASKGLTTR